MILLFWWFAIVVHGEVDFLGTYQNQAECNTVRSLFVKLNNANHRITDCTEKA